MSLNQAYFPTLLSSFPRLLLAALLVLLPAWGLLNATEGATESATEGGETSSEEAAVKAYPSDLCLVTDEKLGSMGDPYVFTEAGYEVKFCCRGCVGSFNRNKETFMAKLKKMHEGEVPAEAKPSDGHHHHHEH